jgi:hypothetical protein
VRSYGFAFLSASVIALSSGTAASKTITVAWDANPAEERVTGYYVYHGTVTRYSPGFALYPDFWDVGDRTEFSLEISDQDSSVHYFAVTAYNEDRLASDFSEEVSSHSSGAVASSPGGGGGGGCFLASLAPRAAGPNFAVCALLLGLALTVICRRTRSRWEAGPRSCASLRPRDKPPPGAKAGKLESG